MTSRTEGILQFETFEPFKVAVDGEMLDQHILIMKDNSRLSGKNKAKSRSICRTLVSTAVQGLFALASLDLARDAQKEETTEEDFDSIESPTQERINKEANSVLMAAIAGGKTAQLVEIFENLLQCGILETADAVPVYKGAIWESMSSKDQEYVTAAYLAFFLKAFNL